jgi:hypothetical protein
MENLDKPKKEKNEGNLRKLKATYDAERIKYNLPEFKFLNENFEIENIEINETELFLKMIRKHMTEKIFYILRGLEMFLNAQNAPLFMYDVIKSFTPAEKDMIRELYKKIAQYEIEAFGLEVAYSEKKEAEFINRFSKDWKEMSPELLKVYTSMRGGHITASKKQNKSYLG